MKRIRLVLIAAILSLSSIFFFSGCDMKAVVADSKTLLDEYYDEYSDKDASGMMSKMHKELIKELGGENKIETRLQARRAILGDIAEYTYGNTEFETVNGRKTVKITVNASYGGGSKMDENFTLTSVDGDLLITGISLPKEKEMDEIADDFILALDDPKKMNDMYIPALQSQEMEKALLNISQKVCKAGGEYVDYEMTGQEYHYMDLGEFDAVYVYSGTYNVKFDKYDFICELQISVQDGKPGVNNVRVIPRFVTTLCEDLFGAIAQKDIKKALNLYSALFFDATTGGEDAWETGVLSPLVNKYGKFLKYTVNDWIFQTTKLPGGKTVETIATAISSEYENLKLKEEISFYIDENGKCRILSHKMEIVK